MSPTDPRPSATCPYAHPGFFADAALATEASTAVVLHATEPSHHALRLDPGVTRTAYVQDGAGAVYQLTATLEVSGASAQVQLAGGGTP